VRTAETLCATTAFGWYKIVSQRLLLVCLCLTCILLSQGCGVGSQKPAVRLISRIIDTGAPAYERETDLELAEQALAANVKLLEALLVTDPRNPSLLLQATRGFAGYTYAFVEARLEAARGRDPQQVAQHTARAQHLYQRGLQYGLRLLSQYHPDWLQATSIEGRPITELLQQLDQPAVPALFWTSFCWGGWLNLERQALETAVLLPRLRVLVQRLLALDEHYFYGLPHVLQAVQYASFTPALGGNPELAQHHFTRARALSQGQLLIVPLLEAQYYAVQIQDRALFTQRLQDILAAPETLFPPQGLLNAVAKHRAALLLQRLDELFF
jgi:hypothetical protein